MNALALDIGGANLKAAHSAGGAWCLPFALWKEPRRLTERLGELASRVPPFEAVLVTMTAELCDCFATRRQGVHHVLEAAAALAGHRPMHVWTTDGRFVTPDGARRDPLRCAAANWNALATFAARLHPDGLSLLIDTGSTTTDVIPLRDGAVAATSCTDTDRLRNGELVYVGAARTPLMALGPTVTFRGANYRVMAEHFATTADVFVLTGDAPEQPTCTDTADDRPLTRACSAARVLRMIGADMEIFNADDANELAGAFAVLARQRVADAVRQVLGDERPNRLIISGGGAFLAADAGHDALPNCEPTSLADIIGADAATAACAYAMLKSFRSG